MGTEGQGYTCDHVKITPQFKSGAKLAALTVHQSSCLSLPSQQTLPKYSPSAKRVSTLLNLKL